MIRRVIHIDEDKCNVGFELRVTYLMLHEMYPFHDSAAINKLEGDVSYNLTLNYTAMRHCYVASWDDDCEIMQDYGIVGLQLSAGRRRWCNDRSASRYPHPKSE